MKMLKTPSRRVRAIVAASVCFWAVATARAADVTATWTSASDGQWTTGANWSTSPAYPDNNALTYNATISMASRQVTLDGNINPAITIQGFTLTGIGAHTPASLNGVNNPTLTVNEPFTWGSASLVGAGTLIAKGGIQFGYIRYASGNNNSWDIELEGVSSYEWDGVSRTSENTGTITLRPGAEFNLVSHRSITGGGTIVVQTDGTAGDAVFKRTGTDGTSVYIANQFNNAGLVQVQNGTLSLTGGGTSSGRFEVDSGKTLSFSGTHTLTGTLGGAGTLAFDGTDTTHDLTTATYAGTGPLRIVGQNTKVIIDADIEIASLTMIGNGGFDNVETQYSAKLDGAGDVRVSGLTTWTHGQPMGTGTLYADGGILFNPSRFRRIYSDRPIVIGGDSAFTTASDGRFWEISADVTNAAGTFQLGDSPRSIQGGGTFHNEPGAVFGKTTTVSSTSSITAPFSNTGTVRVVANGGTPTLTFSNVLQVSGGTLTGGTWQATNGTINLPGGNLLAIGADATVILEGTGAVNTVNTALTTVDGGLFINDGRNFATGAAGLALGSTGVIGGTGTLTGNIAGGGTVSPGASVGTFTLAGDLTPTNGFGFLLEAEDADAAPGTGWDLLLSSGTFDVTGIDPGGLLIDFAAGTGMGDEFSFTMKFAEFASITGTVTEELFSVTDVNSRYIPGVHKFFVNEFDGAFYLNMYIPEPSAFALLLVAGLALARQRPNVKRGA